MKAIILSAGYAMRLYPLTENQPKGLLPLNKKPIINYMMENLETIDEIDEAIVISNHKFYENFNDWSKTYKGRIKLKVLDDGTMSNDDRLGAIGDIQFVLDKEKIDEDIIVVASDNYLKFDLKEYYNFFKKKNADCVLAEEFPKERIDYLVNNFGVAKLDFEDRVTSVVEKPKKDIGSNIALWATYFYTKETVKLFKKYLDEGNPKDSPGNFPAWLCSRKPVYAYRTKKPCVDIGTIKEYKALDNELSIIKGKVLLTGGLGYIGSHTAVEMLDAGKEIVVIDNLFNSKIEVKDKIEKITGKKFKFIKMDLCDKEALYKIFEDERFESVIHFAGYKAVGESCQKPLMYYENNLLSSINLLGAMKEYGVRNLVFSSSACIYGEPDQVPVDETGAFKMTNPYGRTKRMIERIMEDVYASDPKNNFIVLRYFNPIGAHASGLIGEDCNGIPNNLMPYITRVAVGKLEKLSIFGNDYDTPDGTGIRDYIHVVDLAKGHVKALEKLTSENGCFEVYNLGTGNGYSVLEIVTEFNKVSGNKVKYQFAPRRSGDIAKCFASAKKAEKELGWKAELGIHEMCESSYNFQLKQEEENK